MFQCVKYSYLEGIQFRCKFTDSSNTRALYSIQKVTHLSRYSILIKHILMQKHMGKKIDLTLSAYSMKTTCGETHRASEYVILMTM